MPVDKARTSKPASYSQPAAGSAQNLNAGPYVGVVKNNVDPQRMGRLQVWVPYLTPDEKNETTWFTVSYATPFYGFAAPPDEFGSKQNEFDVTKHSYGMWFVPPDLGVRVLITFANGDPNKGYWFACIPEGRSHNMVPSLGATSFSDFKTDKTTTLPENQRPDRVPGVEFNDNDAKMDADPNWYQKNVRPLHQEQFKRLQEQGLEFDYLRGAILSGSQRESPSHTFGVSTPGRRIDPESKSNRARKGGHSFVLDDGDSFGDNNFVRLRTSAGHQILMHDTGNFIYISNANGTAWIELNSNGDIEMFSNGSFSLRSADTINLHADRDINMYAGNKITAVAEQGLAVQAKNIKLNSVEETTIHACQSLDLKSGTTTKIDAATAFSVKAAQSATIRAAVINLNTGSAASVAPLEDITRSSFPNALRNAAGWKSLPKRINSIATRVPTHEPDVNHLSKMDQVRNPNALEISSAEIKKLPPDAARVPPTPVSVLTDSSGNPVLTQDGKPIGLGADTSGGDATQSATAAVPKRYQNLQDYVSKQPDPAAGVGTLTKDETKALYTGIALSESTHNYSAVNQLGYVGKYQFGAAALVEQGYVKPEYYQRYGPGNSVLDNPEAWTGKDGVSSKDGFLSSPGVQEKVMQGYTQTNYDRMVRNGAIKPSDDNATVAGMLQTAHLLGAGGANTWRKTGAGADANNVTGATYFNRGKYAVQTLTNNGSIV